MSGNNDGHDDDDGDDNKVADEYYDISEVHLDRTDALLDAADPLHSCHGPTIASQHRNQTLGLKYKHIFFSKPKSILLNIVVYSLTELTALIFFIPVAGSGT